ncbi:Hpt domain-containing protein, partial [Vibrio parahaemolyticus]|nr:Hpt domain-containing protein [Vibrio parahaemolyticus]
DYRIGLSVLKRKTQKKLRVCLANLWQRILKTYNPPRLSEIKKRVIHGIKGAVGAIGISMLTELCIEAERVTAAEFDRRAAELILRIEQEIDNIDYWAEMNEYTA